jgi:hypothetical protein
MTMSEAGLEEDEAKRRRKEAKAHEQAERPLDPYMRYKALQDTLDSEQDMVELADKKARFALVIMGALNAATLLLASRGGAGSAVTSSPLGMASGVVLGAYASAALYYFVQAIETLRPRGGPPGPPPALPTDPALGGSMRVRYHQDIIRRTRDEYFALWGEIRIENLNAEIAAQVHIVASINRQKYAALTRLYGGLKVLTVIVAVLLVIMAGRALV